MFIYTVWPHTFIFSEKIHPQSKLWDVTLCYGVFYYWLMSDWLVTHPFPIIFTLQWHHIPLPSDAPNQTASNIPILSSFKCCNQLYMPYKVNYSVIYFLQAPSRDLFHLLSGNFWTVSDFSPSPTCSFTHFTITVFFLAFLIAITSAWHQLNPWSCV